MPSTRPSPAWLASVLILAVFAVGTAGPLIRLASAPALAIAFWRMLFSTALTGTFWIAGARAAVTPERLTRRDWLLAALGGLCLAAHFGCWITSLSLTTVAASVVLVNTQPLFAAVWATLFLREPVTPRQWMGIVIAVGGVGVISLEEATFADGGAHLVGNLLAILGAASGAGYYVIGRSLRQRTSLWGYVTRVYGASAVALLLASLVLGVRLAPHPARDWILFVALALGPGLLGHTLLNWSLRWLSAPVVNVIALGEPVVAAVLAAVLPAIAEVPSLWTLVGCGVILTGIALAVGHRRGASRPPAGSPP